MILKMLKIVFSFFLICGYCWAASNPFEYSDALQKKLKKLSENVVVSCDNEKMYADAMMEFIDGGDVQGLAYVLLHRLASPEYNAGSGVTFPLLRAIDALNYNRYPYGKRLECLKLLLECGANPNGELNYQKPLIFKNVAHDHRPSRIPLIFRAVEISDFNAVKTLLEYGADATVLDDKGFSVFFWLAIVLQENFIPEETERIQKLLEHHFFALLCNELEVQNETKFIDLWQFLTKHFDPECRKILAWMDNHGATLLHHAAEFNCPAIASKLLDAGASVDAKDRNGGTPAHYAHYKEHNDVLTVLIVYGSLFNIKPTSSVELPIAGEPTSLYESYAWL